ncbi:hypothetical protein [Fischerella sp. PCC 9605]|uniref:hypothetical protein n=1 Tax=Fischerella sp. PCC 9605 TaxID=1173024 RepID=UPI0004B8065B|nr:hypothetical protein [Fischerella sp. PCC 9605]
MTNQTATNKFDRIEKFKLNPKCSLSELIKIFEEHRNHIIINIKHLQNNYQRKSIKRVQGFRDDNNNLITPWLRTEYRDNVEYVGMGSFSLNRNTATINMLITRKVRLVKVEDKTPTLEVAGLLVNDLTSFNNYTIVSDGKINIKSLQVKISSKKTFDLLKEKGVVVDQEFDFRREYTIRLDNLPLVPSDGHYSSIDGVFYQLAKIKVISSIISAYLKDKSDVFLSEQLDELKNYYFSKNIYINFPTTNEYSDIQEALANGTVEARVSYKIDIGSQDILNLGKLHSANKFLNRMYQVYDKKTGEIISKPKFEIAFHENIAFRHKQLSSRIKITPVDEFMKQIFDDFLGLDNNDIVVDTLTKVGADSLVQVLQEHRNGNTVSEEEMVTALFAANNKLKEFASEIYRDKVSPLVFYIDSTGNLPREMDAKAMTAQEIAAQYPHLQFSKDEQEGTFFVIGNSIISVYKQIEYYSKNVAVTMET